MAVVALRRSVVAGVLLCVSAVGALSGCQGTTERGRAVHAASKPVNATRAASDDSLDGLTAPQISRRMWDAMETTSSMTLEFAGVLRSKPLQMKVAMTTKGTCASAVRQEGWTMRVIRTDDGTAYIRGDAGYWTAMGARGTSIRELAGDRWIKFPSNSASGRRLAGSCDLNTVLDRIEPNHAASTKGGVGTVNGQPVVIIRQKESSGTSTLSVAAKGKPYLLRIASAEAMTVTFGAFDQPLHVTAPPANQTIDLSLFGGDSGLDV